MKYRHVFFDLDHTLWDFEKNSEETIYHLFEEFKLNRYDFTCTDFFKKYSYVNKRLWQLYNAGKVNQEQLRRTRFTKTLRDLGVPQDEIPFELEHEYLRICPTKSACFPFTPRPAFLSHNISVTRSNAIDRALTPSVL